jgi:Arc/MetJ-type ribon-helix-helix transcriptional regulator
VKVSVSLPEADVDFVDAYAKESAASRSAVIHDAIALLRESRLEDDYTAAWAEWDESEDAQLWDRTTGDGVSGAAR